MQTVLLLIWGLFHSNIQRGAVSVEMCNNSNIKPRLNKVESIVCAYLYNKSFEKSKQAVCKRLKSLPLCDSPQLKLKASEAMPARPTQPRPSARWEPLPTCRHSLTKKKKVTTSKDPTETTPSQPTSWTTYCLCRPTSRSTWSSLNAQTGSRYESGPLAAGLG